MEILSTLGTTVLQEQNPVSGWPSHSSLTEGLSGSSALFIGNGWNGVSFEVGSFVSVHIALLTKQLNQRYHLIQSGDFMWINGVN